MSTLKVDGIRSNSAASDAISLDSNGRVGIGTSSPGDKLHVSGTTNLAGNSYLTNTYVSGNIYLGGTGSANAFDDYEEGNWTPAWSDASSGGTAATINQIHARYTKIGRVVTLHFYTWSIMNQGTSNAIYLQGLPFAVQGSMSFMGSVAGRYFNQGADNQYNLTLRVNANNTYGNLEWSESHSGDAVAATFAGIVNAYTNFTGTLVYLTDS
jgi:hypothetical protein